MYCSHCGSLAADNLNYCKNCGKRNEQNRLPVGNSSSRGLSYGAVAIGTIGLAFFFPVLRELLRSGVDPTVMVILLVAYLATVLAMFSILVGHVWKNAGDIRIKGAEQRTPDPEPYFRAVNTAQLPGPTEMPASVTEHTTRTLDEVRLRER